MDKKTGNGYRILGYDDAVSDVYSTSTFPTLTTTSGQLSPTLDSKRRETPFVKREATNSASVAGYALAEWLSLTRRCQVGARSCLS